MPNQHLDPVITSLTIRQSSKPCTTCLYNHDFDFNWLFCLEGCQLSDFSFRSERIIGLKFDCDPNVQRAFTDQVDAQCQTGELADTPTKIRDHQARIKKYSPPAARNLSP
jgi:hypothetical protein